MAGLTDTAFRRLVKRHGGCGLVVTEMVSSEGLVRGIDRTLEYAEFTDEERPVAVQIFGGDPEKMALAAQVVERLGADAVDVNMGCPVPKVAKGQAGCSLMRDPERAAAIVRAMARAVAIPVTVKMRAGWDDRELNAPELAQRLEARRRVGRHRARAHRRAGLQRARRLGPDRAGRAGGRDPGLRQRRLRRARRSRAPRARPRRGRRARRPRRAPQSLDLRPGGRVLPRAGPVPSCRSPTGAASCSTTSTCSSSNASTNRRASTAR